MVRQVDREEVDRKEEPRPDFNRQFRSKKTHCGLDRVRLAYGPVETVVGTARASLGLAIAANVRVIAPARRGHAACGERLVAAP